MIISVYLMKIMPLKETEDTLEAWKKKKQKKTKKDSAKEELDDER